MEEFIEASTFILNCLVIVAQCGGIHMALSVMVEEAPHYFSPFSELDSSLFAHLPFNDFILLSFPDLARHLNLWI